MSQGPAKRPKGRPVARSARAATEPEAGAWDRWRAQFARRMRTRLLAPVELEITDNTYTMISFSRRDGSYRVRLHHMFLGAPDEVLSRLAGYIRGDDPAASGSLDQYIHRNRRLIRQLPPVARQRRLPLQAQGRVHHLRELLEEVGAELLPGAAAEVAIAWAPAPRVRLPRRSIKLGSYSADTQIIRIHPALDQPEVPAYFVRWIIFHELLHHLFREDLKARRGRVHTPEFCERERAFPELQEAIEWERQHLDLLLWWDPDGDPHRPGLPLAS